MINTLQRELFAKVKTLPTLSGVYLFKTKQGRVLYVGKAKNLRSRVTTYFDNSSKNIKTSILVGHVEDFDFIVTDSEVEALVLENNLIKKHRPKYNISLRDDRTYPYVLIDYSHAFPRMEYTRSITKGEGDKDYVIFGPFVTGSNISEVIRVLAKSFQIRTCSDSEFKKRKVPCIRFQMHQCLGPCVLDVEKNRYDDNLELATNFLQGKGEKSLEVLVDRMNDCADQQQFEQAVVLRDYIFVLKKFSNIEGQENVEIASNKNIDVVAFFRGEEEIDITIYVLRNGILMGSKNFYFPLDDFSRDCGEEVLESLFNYYTCDQKRIPDMVVVPFEDDDIVLFQQSLDLFLDDKKRKKHVKIISPKRKFKSLYELALKNARCHQEMRIKNDDSVFAGLQKLKELLNLKEIPRTIECFDIAIWQGESPAGAQVVFIDGKPCKEYYRHYSLEKRIEGNNDFAMMKELITRRCDNGNLPDLFVVDGGIGQVNIFQEVLKELEMDIPVVGVAKTRNESGIQKGGERLVIPLRSNPYILAKHKSLFKILTHIRDEAHRFSRRLHHKMEHKRLFRN